MILSFMTEFYPGMTDRPDMRQFVACHASACHVRLTDYFPLGAASMKKLLLTFCALVALPALADTVKIDNAWVRATAPGQKVAGAFMDLTADADMTLISAASPAAKVVELHTMSMDNGVMIMRQVKEIGLPKSKTINLKPGGLHVMLIDLTGQIKPGDKTPVTLSVRGGDGKVQTLALELDARPAGSSMQKHMH
jgi:copper(I)-binding protein